MCKYLDHSLSKIIFIIIIIIITIIIIIIIAVVGNTITQMSENQNCERIPNNTLI